MCPATCLNDALPSGLVVGNARKRPAAAFDDATQAGNNFGTDRLYVVIDQYGFDAIEILVQQVLGRRAL